MLQKTYTVDFLTRKRLENDGQVPKYYVEESYPPIIDKDTWEAVQLELEIRRTYAEENVMKRSEYATIKNPFAGKVICGNCNKIYGRKTWNSTSKRFRRIIWRCNNKCSSKGVKGCDGKHIDNDILYKTFGDTFNIVVENIDDYMEKWEKQTQSEHVLKRITAKRFIEVFEKVKPIEEFDVDLYFKLLEKITVYDEKLIVTLLDGSEVEWKIE